MCEHTGHQPAECNWPTGCNTLQHTATWRRNTDATDACNTAAAADFYRAAAVAGTKFGGKFDR